MSLGRRYLPIITVVLITLFAAIYAPALGHGFVKDDFRWIASAQVHSPADIVRIFSTNVGFYRPLVTTAFAIDRAVWNLDPRGYALTNVTLLMANAGLLFLLARRLSLPVEAALFAAAVWAFNVHGINMALLWTSGRTALLLCLFAQAAALVLLSDGRWAPMLAGVLALAAMLSKEEAVLLPPLFVVLQLLADRHPTARAIVNRSWPLCAAVVIYLVARGQSGAFTISNAPDYYRPTFNPLTVLKNIGEYLDRGATFAAVASVAAWLAAPRGTTLAVDERRALQSGVSWFIAMYGITMFVPVRSSLYAVAPSIGSAVVAGAFASRAWRAAPARFGRVAAAMIVVIALLVPVYRSRNHGLVEPAELATQSLATIQTGARSHPDARDIVLVDDPRAPVTLDSAFGALFPDAIHLFVSPEARGSITNDAVTVAGDALVFELRDGRLIQPRARISGSPAESSASHSG